MSVHDTLWSYLEMMLPPVRPTPSAEFLARHATVRAFLRLLSTHFIVDSARQVVSDVSHILGNPDTTGKFLNNCQWDSVRGSWVLCCESTLPQRTLLHMGFAPCCTLVWFD